MDDAHKVTRRWRRRTLGLLGLFSLMALLGACGGEENPSTTSTEEAVDAQDGVYSQGGAMSLGVLQALEAAGREPLPGPGEGNNEFLKEWARLADEQGYSSIAPSQPPSLVVDALNVALQVLAGEDPGPTPAVDLPVITDDTLGDTVRPDLPNSLWLPTDLPEEKIVELFS